MTTSDEWFAELTELRSRAEELHPDLVDWLVEDDRWHMLRHPLVFHPLPDLRRCAWANSLYAEKTRMVEEAIEHGDLDECVFFHERPHRLEAFLTYLEIKEVSDAEYWQMLSEVWEDSESIWQEKDAWDGSWNSERPDKSAAMTAEAREELAKLSDPITVYRGCPVGESHDDHGLSWTLNLEKARWFAKRFAALRGPCLVLEGQVGKSDVHALLQGRNEQEIVSSKVVITRRLNESGT
jgi:hypothetical protein